MSTSVTDAAAARAWCDEDNLWVALADGRQLAVPLAYFPRLLHATPEQRATVEMSGRGTGLHWPEIDEDISVEGLLHGGRDATGFGREHAQRCEVCLSAETAAVDRSHGKSRRRASA